VRSRLERLQPMARASRALRSAERRCQWPRLSVCLLLAQRLESGRLSASSRPPGCSSCAAAPCAKLHSPDQACRKQSCLTQRKSDAAMWRWTADALVDRDPEPSATLAHRLLRLAPCAATAAAGHARTLKHQAQRCCANVVRPHRLDAAEAYVCLSPAGWRQGSR
jgi:hypothetical protein